MFSFSLIESLNLFISVHICLNVHLYDCGMRGVSLLFCCIGVSDIRWRCGMRSDWQRRTRTMLMATVPSVSYCTCPSGLFDGFGIRVFKFAASSFPSPFCLRPVVFPGASLVSCLACSKKGRRDCWLSQRHAAYASRMLQHGGIGQIVSCFCGRQEAVTETSNACPISPCC